MLRPSRCDFLWMTPQLCFLFTVVLVVGSGCQRKSSYDHSNTNPPPSVETELSWDDQIKALRDGDSTEISSHHVAVTPDEFSQLLDGCEELRVLEIDHSQIGNNSLGEVLSKLPKLRQLRLESDVNNEQLATIAEALPNTKVFNFPHASFNNSAIKKLTTHPSLELFRFSSPNVDDDGMKAIAQIPELRFLHLINVPITDAGLKHIASAENLESFYLDGGECAEEGLSELIRSRPDLHFHWNQLHLENDPKDHAH